MYIRVALLKAERKIPKSLLRAHCQQEEVAEMTARGLPFLSRATRREIAEDVQKQLMPSMPPTLSSIPAVLDLGRNRVYAQAMSEKDLDVFIKAFKDTTGLEIIPCIPEYLALKSKGINARDLNPVCFSPDVDNAIASEGLGMDFITWVWYFWESSGGNIASGAKGQGEPFAIMLEDPLTFVVEGEGAHVAVLRRGTPLISAEAKTALMSGKKLQRCKALIAHGEETWGVSLNAADFAFRSLGLPKIEPAESAVVYQERMRHLNTFVDVFHGLFDHFLELRRNPRPGNKWWPKCALGSPSAHHMHRPATSPELFSTIMPRLFVRP
jgi:hypothetical protein